MCSGLKVLNLGQILAQMKEKLCKVIPSYTKNVSKHTIIRLQQNYGKCLKYSKIKHFRRFLIDDKNTFRMSRQHLQKHNG